MDRKISIQKENGRRKALKILIVIVVFTMISIMGPRIEAQKFPDKPVQLIVPFGAGSGTDLFVRGIQPYAEKYLGVRLVISNVPGADTRIGMAKLHKAKPDGFTIGSVGYPAPLVSELLFDLPYRAIDFSFIYAWGRTAMFFFVAENSSLKSIDDIPLEARKRSLTVGVPGIGTTTHLLALTMEKHLNVKFKIISYSNTAEVHAAVAGNHIDASISGADAALGLVRAKKIHPILVWSSQPDSNFPDTPLSTKYNMPSFPFTRGVMGPPGIPEKRVLVLEKVFSRAAAEPKFLEWMKSRGIDVISLSAKQYRQELEKQQLQIREYKDLLKPS